MTADDGTFSEMDGDIAVGNLIGFPHYDGKLKTPAWKVRKRKQWFAAPVKSTGFPAPSLSWNPIL